MKPRFNRFLGTSITVVAALSSSVFAVDRIKLNNATALNLAGSWDVLPTSSDVVVWNSTVTGANTTDLGGNLSWAGIKIVDPGGLVTIRHAAGQTLTLGASGIDMSSATQNLTLMSAATANTAGTLAISANQTWNIASGRALTLFSTSNSANQRLSGSGNIQVTGGGVVNLNVGDAGSTSFTAGNGNDTYTGNWTITGGSKVISLRNGTHAWGQGTITLDNGTMSQTAGNWSFSNNISIASGGGTIYSDSSGNNRYMNLTGVISGSGALSFNSLAAMTAQEGFILTGANTFTGPMTINANATVRIGGDATTTMNSTGAGTLGSIQSSVAITNNGILGFGRTDEHTFANSISGTGIVRLGRVGGVLPTTQVVTLSGASNYTGATQVNAGRLNLTGSLTSAITVASGASISGNGSTTGLLTLSSGGGLALAGGAVTTGLTVNGATFSGSNLVTFLNNPIADTVYDVFKYGTGTVTTPGNLSVGWRGTLSNDAINQKYIFTAGASGTRTWNATSGTWAQGIAGNWTEGDQTFYGGDTVVFNEPASASTVTLSGRLAPTSVSVSNTTNTYTFAGTDGTADITGASTLSKSGAGTLIITSAHTYTGTTTVSGGVLDVGNGGATGALGSGAISVGAGSELVFNRSNNFTVSNVISGDGLVTKKGAGRMTVNGDNSGGEVNWNFTGTGNGDIGFQNASALGGIGSTITLGASATGSAFFASNGNTTGVNISLGSGAVFTWNGSTGNTTTVSGVISGDGSLAKVSGETLRLTGVNTYSGTTTITNGTLELGGSGQLGSGSHAGQIANSATFFVNSTANQTISGVISGGGALNKSNTGTLVLTANNTYTGNTTISDGTLQIGGSGVLGNGNYAGTISNSSLFFVNSSSEQTLAGAISGTGSLEKSSSGTLTLSTVNSYTGGTTVNGGTLRLTASSGGAGTIRGTLTANADTTIEIGGTDVLGYSTGSDAVRTLNLNGATLVQTQNRNETVTAVVNMAGGSTISATGGPSAAFDLFGGGARINASGDATNTISAPLRLRQNDSVFDVSDGVQAVDLLVSGVISHGPEGNGAILKSGNGTLTLAGNNTYSGPTTVDGGTLVINGSVSTGNLTVHSGASLMGSGTIGGATTIDAGGTLSPGGSPGLLTINNTLSLGGITLMEIGGLTLGTDYDSVAVSGLLTYGGDLSIVSYNSYNLAQVASYNLFSISGGETGTFDSVTVGALALVNTSGVWSAEDGGLTYTFTESTGTLVVIPEPRAALLGGIGMLFLLRRRRTA